MSDWLQEPYEVADLDALDEAFPASVRALMPDPETLPSGYRNFGKSKWMDFWEASFYRGLTSYEVVPREGIDPAKAMRHLNCIAGSWEPKHEDKFGALRFLSERWFSDVTWKAAS